MEKSAKGVFDSMMKKNDQPAKKEDKPVKEVKEVKPVAPVESAPKKEKSLRSRGNLNTTAEATKSILYRTTPGFYLELSYFAKIKKLSMNTIIETALINYMDLPENKDAKNVARSQASSVK